MNQSLVDRVNALLRHYFTPVESDKVKTARMRDWVDDLSEFTPECQDRAIAEWRRAHPDKRPTPGHIRELCLIERERNAARGTSRSRPGKLIFRNNAAEDALENEKRRVYAEAEVCRDNFARQQGFKNYGEYLRAKSDGKHRLLPNRPIQLPPRPPALTYGLSEEPPF